MGKDKRGEIQEYSMTSEEVVKAIFILVAGILIYYGIQIVSSSIAISIVIGGIVFSSILGYFLIVVGISIFIYIIKGEV